jgi:hypothetical protein
VELTDEGAARSAGDRVKLPEHPRRFAYEYASGRWRAPPEILFTTSSPTCEACGAFVVWGGPPTPIDGGFRYRVVCQCPEPEGFIFSPFRLCTGGTDAWWDRFTGRAPAYHPPTDEEPEADADEPEPAFAPAAAADRGEDVARLPS